MSKRETIFSGDRVYRYTLWREFEAEFLFEGGNRMNPGYVQFIGLNPSTADENKDDPTIRRCIDFTKRWGYGAMCMTNLFAFRATDPNDMKANVSPFSCPGESPTNSDHVLKIAREAGIVVAAWGVHGIHLNGEERLRALLASAGQPLHHLGLTKDGHPKHPLYLTATTQPTEWKYDQQTH